MGLDRFLTPGSLPAPGAWRPFPTASDRAAWDGVDPLFRGALLDRADAEAARPWPRPLASSFARFQRDGDREEYGQPYLALRDRTTRAVLAACLTGEPARVDAAVDGLWALCELTTWSLPAHDRPVIASGAVLPDPGRPALDIIAGDIAALFGWADLLLGEQLDGYAPVLRRRLRREVDRRVLDPFLEQDWWWFSGPPLNNWNPWCLSNVLAAALLLGEDAARRDAIVARAVDGLSLYLDHQPADGGCEEGVSYWWPGVGRLFFGLELLHDATGGAFDPFGLPVLAELARYPGRAHIGAGWYVNIGDASARSEDVYAARTLHRLGQVVRDPEVVRHARSLRAPGEPVVGVEVNLGHTLTALFDPEWASAPTGTPTAEAQVWLPDTGLFAARQHPGRATGLFVAANANHNGVSHNHNDVGSFIVALDGTPRVVDVGVGTYTRQTFSEERYSIWTMRSGWHNLPELAGFEQLPGPEFAARDVTAVFGDDCGSGGDSAALSLDLAGTWSPDAGVDSWRRRIALDRDAGAVTVRDTWRLAAAPERLRLHLMLHGEVTAGAGLLRVEGLRIGFDRTAFDLRVEEVPLTDPRLAGVWGPLLHRAVLTAKAPTRRGSHTLSFRGAP